METRAEKLCARLKYRGFVRKPGVARVCSATGRVRGVVKPRMSLEELEEAYWASRLRSPEPREASR